MENRKTERCEGRSGKAHCANSQSLGEGGVQQPFLVVCSLVHLPQCGHD